MSFIYGIHIQDSYRLPGGANIIKTTVDVIKQLIFRNKNLFPDQKIQIN